jgi:hypothetical protein
LITKVRDFFPGTILLNLNAGFRVVALPLLPISGHTLVYGCGDGGKTIMMTDAFVEEAMKHAAQFLHLAAHRVQGALLCSAGDVEVHKDEQDDVYYLIDLARCYPPECLLTGHEMCQYDPLVYGSIFFRMLRPEFLQICKNEQLSDPLSPDAFSGWGILDRDDHNPRISLATSILFERQVPKVAEYFDKYGESQLDLTKISDIFHRYGLNVRHIGLTLAIVKSHPAKLLLLKEAWARILKQLIRSLIRGHILQQEKNYSFDLTSKDISEDLPLFLNTLMQAIIAQRPVSDVLQLCWDKFSLMFGFQFFQSCSKAELLQVFAHSFKTILRKVFEDCGIVLIDACRNVLMDDTEKLDFYFDITDFEDYVSSFVKLDNFSYYEARQLCCRADHLDLLGHGRTSALLRQRALKKLSQGTVNAPAVLSFMHSESLKMLNSFESSSHVEKRASSVFSTGNRDQKRFVLEKLCEICPYPFSKPFSSMLMSVIEETVDKSDIFWILLASKLTRFDEALGAQLFEKARLLISSFSPNEDAQYSFRFVMYLLLLRKRFSYPADNTKPLAKWDISKDELNSIEEKISSQFCFLPLKVAFFSLKCSFSYTFAHNTRLFAWELPRLLMITEEWKDQIFSRKIDYVKFHETYLGTCSNEAKVEEFTLKTALSFKESSFALITALLPSYLTSSMFQKKDFASQLNSMDGFRYLISRWYYNSLNAWSESFGFTVLSFPEIKNHVISLNR